MILRYGHYNMVERFLDMFENPFIFESKDDFDSILKDFSKDIKFNYGLILTFGTGIKAMYPIVENLVVNENLNIEVNASNILLITLAALAITYLEENNNGVGDDKIPCVCKSKSECDKCKNTGFITSKVTRADARTILEELKLRGIGNGIIKKMTECFKSIRNIIKIIFKKSHYTINGLIDMFGYTALMVPTMNAISSLIGEYDLNMTTLPGNFLALGVGVGTFLAKRGFNYLVKLLKDKLGLKVSYLDIPIKPYEIADGEYNKEKIGKNSLIKEYDREV